MPGHDLGAGLGTNTLLEDLIKVSLVGEAIDVVRSLWGNKKVLFAHEAVVG